MEYVIISAMVSTAIILVAIFIFAFNITKEPKGADKDSAPSGKLIGKIDYTEKMIEFIKHITMQVSIMKYRSFLSTHELDKITKAQIQKLVTETASDVNQYLTTNLIDADELLVSRDFIDNCIIQTSIMTIEDLLNRSVNESIQ